MLKTCRIAMRWILWCLILLPSSGGRLRAQSVDFDSNWNRNEIWQQSATAYAGDSIATDKKTVVDRSTLTGKVVCGYQGWFTCPGDGSDRGWHHWGGRRGFKPGSCSIDLWPDVSELDADEKYETPFQLADGSTAPVYSPLNAKTVNRHFQWMKDYGIDGAFVQRFGVEVRSAKGLFHFNRVLSNCRAAANRHGRTYAVMYDLSGLRSEDIQSIKDDWKQLVDQMKIGRDENDKAYQFHNGKPLVAVWGIGFNDNRKYNLTDCESLIDFLKDDPAYGGNAVMIGVPSYWRSLQRDALSDSKLHDLVRKSDIVSPWSVGRYARTIEVENYANEVWEGDVSWCAENRVDYLPVVFPGFSWHNMNPRSPLGQIPRRGGKFLWEQFTAAKKSGATMVYQAMFDEVDEATAIFKCSQNPPVGESTFLDFEGKPSDFYLWLVGQGGRLIRDEIETDGSLPERK